MRKHRAWLWALVVAVACVWRSPVQAQCGDVACLHAGSTVANVSTGQSAMLDGLLSSMVGANIDLSVANHQSLANSSVRLDTLLGSLQAAGVAATPQGAAQADITLNQLFTASAAALRAQGNTTGASALDVLAVQVASLPANRTIKVADLVTFDSRPETLANSQLNVLDLVSGSAGLFNQRNAVTLDTRTISGSDLGLSGLLNSVQLSVRVIEPATFVCGSAGATFRSAAIRIRARVDLVDTTTPLSLGNLLGLGIKLVDLDLVAEVARGEGTLSTVNVVTSAVTVQASPGLAALYLGTVSDAAVLDRTTPIDVATELQPATLARLELTLLGIVNSVGITLKGSAIGGAGAPSNLQFTGPYPQTRTATAGASSIGTLITSLLGGLEIQVSIPGSWGLLPATVNSLLSLVTTTLKGTGNILQPVLQEVGDGLLNPLLTQLGVRLGAMDVTVDRVFRVPTGAACEDGAYCTVSDTCNGAGVCQGTARVCAEDALSCTTMACNENNDACEPAVTTGCLIGGSQCVADGAIDPGNGCRACNPTTSRTTYTTRATGSSCNDGFFCTTNDTCNVLGVCTGGALLDCSDSLSCTTDLCNELTDTCDHTTLGACLIDGSCVPDGALRPLFPCQTCNIVQNLLGWSPRMAGACDDGLGCTTGDACIAGICTGSQKDCSDGVACTVDTCNPLNGQCSNTTLGCVIDSSCILPGAIDPSNPCRACNPLVSSTAWSPLPSGTLCNDQKSCTTGDSCNGSGVCGGTTLNCADALPCTTDACSESAGGCTHVVATGCAIAGSCLPQGAVNPNLPCQVCDPSVSPTTWSNRSDGTTCSDGLFCTSGDSCLAGLCIGGFTDCSDGVLCTVDTCDEAGDKCNHTAPGCVIGASCIGAGTDEPGNSCRSCQPLISINGWTPKILGAQCDDGLHCTTADACNGSGTCAGTTLNCADSQTCTTDSCSEAALGCTHVVNTGCSIDGLCIASGTINVNAPCMVCDPLRATGAWSPRPEGTSCSDGLFCTNGDTCSALGVCLPGTLPACVDDGLTCTAEVCSNAGSSCTSVLSSGCLIGGLCILEGQRNPVDACQTCRSASAKNGWTLDLTGCDSDQDGLFDAFEQVDGQDVDHDGDTIVDRLDPDDDGDSLRTRDENADPNGNGRPDDARDLDLDRVADYLDRDDDGDGRDTRIEVTEADTYGEDVDNDDLENWYDTESDGDGALDVTENVGNGDANNDGTPDYLDPNFARGDADKDGLPDDVECVNQAQTCPDADQDGQPDWLDADDDGDGVNTLFERPDGKSRDTDGDGVSDYLDPDDDQDGILTADEQADPNGDHKPDDAVDTDEDGIPNFLDREDDGDGVHTRFERRTIADRDGNGIPDYLDPDDDGDTIPTIDENSDPNGNGDPADARDLDEDGLPDYLDADDDGDGISTKQEREDALIYGTDFDSDGIPNWYDPDSDDDGIPDGEEPDDEDGDGVPDYLMRKVQTPDAGLPDASIPDAATPEDGGALDSSVPDGGAPDAEPGAADAGADDADLQSGNETVDADVATMADADVPSEEDAEVDDAGRRLPRGRAAGGGICSASPAGNDVPSLSVLLFASLCLGFAIRRRRAA